jgi:hypothetical protein
VVFESNLSKNFASQKGELYELKENFRGVVDRYDGLFSAIGGWGTEVRDQGSAEGGWKTSWG